MYFETVRGQSSSGLPPTRPSMDIRILVVDDDATTLTIVSSILQLLHYKVETAKNPLEALATLRMHKGFFDLVVTDLHMPYMNGFELQKLVEEEFKIPVIIMSADDTESVLFESATRGIVLFLPKPVSANDLRDLWMYTPRAKKGKSVVIKEITEPEPHPNPNADAAPPLCIDLCDDDDNGDDNNNADDDQGPPPSLSGPRSSSFAGNGASSLAGAGGALVLRNQFGKRGGRSPAKDGKKKASKTPKRSCRRTENQPPGGPGSCPKTRKPKIVWTNWLHNRFLLAIRHLNLDKAFPKRILEFMDVPGLTRENVASHLQKYRLFLKKIAENGLASTKMLGDKLSSLRSSFAIGYPIQMMLENAQQLYPQLAGSSQPLMLTAPPQQHQSQSASLAPNYNSNNVPFSGNHSVPQITGPVGVPTLLTNNQPAANVVQQPPMLAAPNFNGTNTNANTSGNVGSAASGGPNNPYAHVNYGGNNSFAGSVNPMPVWQQQNQARVVPFAGTNYPSNNNFGVTGSAISGNWNPDVGSASSGHITNMAANNSAGFHIMNGGSQMNMAGHINQSPAGGDVPNIRINGCGGRLGMLNGANLNGNVNVVRPMQENWGNGGAFGHGNQVGGRSSFSGFPGADSPLPAAQAPQVLPSINYQQQQNANVAALPQPPQPRPPRAQIPEIGRRERENNNNKAETELGDVVDNNDIILPPVDLRALLDDFPSDISDISFEGEREVSPPTNQVAPQNPDPFAAGPAGVQENHCVLGTEQAPPNLGGSVFPATSENYIPHPEIPNHVQARVEDLIDPFQFMNIESLNGPEVDWDKFFDAVLEDDFGKGEWSWE